MPVIEIKAAKLCGPWVVFAQGADTKPYGKAVATWCFEVRGDVKEIVPKAGAGPLRPVPKPTNHVNLRAAVLGKITAINASNAITPYNPGGSVQMKGDYLDGIPEAVLAALAEDAGWI